MSNEVEIVVRDRDATGPGFAKARAKARKLGDDIQDTIGDSGKKAGEEFSKGLGAEVDKGNKKVHEKTKAETGSWKKTFAKIGMEGGEQLSFGMLKSSPAIAPVGAALGGVLLSAMSGAVMAGATVGAIGLGAVLLKEEPAVRQAASHLMSSVGETMTDAAKPLAKPFIMSMRNIETELGKMGPLFGTTFKNAAPSVNILSDGLMGLVKNVMPGLNTAIDRSGPVVRALGGAMDSLGDAASDALMSMSEDAEGAATSIDAISTSVNFLVRQLGAGAGDMNKLMSEIKEEAEIWRHEGVGFFDWLSKFDGGPLGNWAEGAEEKLSSMGNALSNDADHARTFGRQIRQGAGALGEFNDALAEMSTLTLKAADADIGFQQAIDDATKAIKNNGKHLDINTQKGRDNRSALLDIASGAIDAAASISKMGGSQASATRRLNQGYTAFVSAARGAGMTKTAADKLARSYGLLPRAKKTNVSAPGAKGSKAQVDSLRHSINRLRGKDVFVTTHFVTKGGGAGSTIGQHAMAMGGISAAQTGGPRSGLTWVGERGPELMDLQPGTRVHSAQDSTRLAGQGGGVGTVLLEIKSSGRPVDDFIAEMLRKYVKARAGGNVQVAFGKRGG